MSTNESFCLTVFVNYTICKAEKIRAICSTLSIISDPFNQSSTPLLERYKHIFDLVMAVPILFFFLVIFCLFGCVAKTKMFTVYLGNVLHFASDKISYLGANTFIVALHPSHHLYNIFANQKALTTINIFILYTRRHIFYNPFYDRLILTLNDGIKVLTDISNCYLYV